MNLNTDKTDRQKSAARVSASGTSASGVPKPAASTLAAVDLINGPIMKNLLIFMLPILVSYIFQQLYNAVDTAIVGHYLGEQSLAAVGANVAIFDLMVMFAQSLGNGLCIVVSRSFGAGDEKMLRKSVAGSLVIGAGTIAVMTVLNLLGLGPLLRILGTPEAIYGEALAYIRIIGGGIVVMFAYNLLSSLLRAIGNSAMSLVFLIISSVLNIILDVILVAGVGMGVRGAATATVIAQGISAVLCAGYILKREQVLIPHREDFDCGKELYLELAGQGYALAFMGSIVNIGSAGVRNGVHGICRQYRICDPAVRDQQPGGDRDRGAHDGEKNLYTVRAAESFDGDGDLYFCLAE